MSWRSRAARWFRGGSAPRASRRAEANDTDRASRDALAAFVASRRGVEAYLEPRTTVYSTTLLLIADDGEYLRRPVHGVDEATSWCRSWNIPLYDAARVGYPRRLRDYVRGTPRAPIRIEDLPPWPDDDHERRDPPHDDPSPPRRG